VPVTEKASLMESVNEGIALFATDASPPETRWMFVCECGLPECVEWVELELSGFEEIRSDPDRSVLAEGHTASPSRHARSMAADLREQARALRGQAKLQRDRAQHLSE
jgi:hypothetical protein